MLLAGGARPAGGAVIVACPTPRLSAAVVAFGLFVYACLVAIIWGAGGTVSGGAARMVPLLVWLIMAVQTLAQASVT